MSKKYVSDEELKSLYEQMGMIQIAEVTGMHYVSVWRRLHKIPEIKIRKQGNNEIHKVWKKHGLCSDAKLINLNPETYVRLQVIKKLGCKCSNCGISDIRVLDINHIDGKDKQKKSYKQRLDFLNGKQMNWNVLCCNCNRLHEFDRGNRDNSIRDQWQKVLNSK